MPQTPIAVDPTGCGCTECLVGEYVPLENATPADIAGLVTGQVADNSESFWYIRNTGIDTTEVVGISALGERSWPMTNLDLSAVTLSPEGRAQYDSAYELSRATVRR